MHLNGKPSGHLNARVAGSSPLSCLKSKMDSVGSIIMHFLSNNSATNLIDLTRLNLSSSVKNKIKFFGVQTASNHHYGI